MRKSEIWETTVQQLKIIISGGSNCIPRHLRDSPRRENRNFEVSEFLHEKIFSFKFAKCLKLDVF